MCITFFKCVNTLFSEILTFCYNTLNATQQAKAKLVPKSKIRCDAPSITLLIIKTKSAVQRSKTSFTTTA